MIIQVLPQKPYNFSYLASSATESVIVADNIPVSGARTVALSVRIHRLTLSAGASFEFKVGAVDPSPTDGTVFASGTLASTGTITSSSPNLVGLSAIISDPVYPFVRVTLHVVGPSSTGTTYFELSADLVVRQAASACQCGSSGPSPLAPFKVGTRGGASPAGSSYAVPYWHDSYGCFCVSTIDNTWYKQPCLADGTAPGCFGNYSPGRCKEGKSPLQDPKDGSWDCV